MPVLLTSLAADIDGFLVGGACMNLLLTLLILALKPEFVDIVNCKSK